MEIKLKLNGKAITASVDADTVLLDFLRDKGCLSVKRGCDTSNCGLCTVLMDGKPILSCSTLAVRADGHEIHTLEGLQAEASDFVGFIADQGADQCGFCNPGFVMNTIALLREKGCLSVKRGCDTSNCGLCTVLMDGKPILSCSTLAVRADGHEIYTLEGLQEEASDFVGFIADQGADQCGFCNPGFVMNTIALLRENPDPTDDEIRAFLAGNLCRCSGYDGQLRGIRNYLNSRKA